jgi:hypothetical protein
VRIKCYVQKVITFFIISMDILKVNPDPRLEPAPEPTAFDFGLAIAKVGSIAFPFFGGGVTLFDLVTAPLRGKRLSDWCEELRLRLNELSQTVEGLSPESLAKHEAFISAFAHATQAALKTHHQEKLGALRNAVLNVAAGSAPDKDLQSIFLSLVDSFTPLHLRVLEVFRRATPVRIVDAPAWLRKGGWDICQQTATDLQVRGLLAGTPNRLQLILAQNGVYSFHAPITPLGNQFLSFITRPELTK